jgi:hypothetical protein
MGDHATAQQRNALAWAMSCRGCAVWCGLVLGLVPHPPEHRQGLAGAAAVVLVEVVEGEAGLGDTGVVQVLCARCLAQVAGSGEVGENGDWTSGGRGRLQEIQ